MNKINKTPKNYLNGAVESFLNNDIWVDRKTIYFGGEINSKGEDIGIDPFSAKMLIKQLLLLDSLDPNEHITIILDSPGGSVTNGMAIYDLLRAMKTKVHIIILGIAMSMAVVVVQGSDKRIASKNSKLMIHDGSVVLSGNPKDVDLWNSDQKRDQKIYYDIIYEKLKGVEKNKNLPPSVIRALKIGGRSLKGLFTLKDVEAINHVDLILTADEALQLNLIDSILPSK